MTRTVKQLTAHAENFYNAKQQQENLEAKRTERKRLIDSVPDVTITEFYCKCHQDFVSYGGKVTFRDTTGLLCAYYVSFGQGYKVGESPDRKFNVCRVKRYITDKLTDPYYTDSPMLKRQRIELADDLLQPNDPRFKAKYGDPYKKYYEQLEAKERKDL